MMSPQIAPAKSNTLTSPKTVPFCYSSFSYFSLLIGNVDLDLDTNKNHHRPNQRHVNGFDMVRLNGFQRSLMRYDAGRCIPMRSDANFA